MRRNFVTIHRICTNVDLLKDVGLIPYFLAKNKNYNCKIICTKNSNDYSYIKKYIPIVQLEFLNKRFSYIHQLFYVIKTAKNIDILNMYHLSIHNSLLTMKLFKILNPRAKAYLKLDLDYRGIKQIEEYSTYKLLVIKRLLKSVDVVSAESKSICKRFQDRLGKECIYIPNGYFEDSSDVVEYLGKKENVFLTVGRLGTTQKRTEDLIDAFEMIYDKCDWKLELVGPYTEQLNQYIEVKCEHNKSLKTRISLIGEIKDKNKLNIIYDRANALVMPSEWESFGIVIVEAMNKGCFCVLSDAIPPANDFINGGKCGRIFPCGNTKKLADILLNITQKKSWDPEYIKNFTKNTFDWKIIVDRLFTHLK